ncbi:MAG: putative Ig domain-containing protein [Candidatus Dadabacteria bacterium]|nr:putative Ig domain-containing protein [Candidatus Dadabacteria bacterium]
MINAVRFPLIILLALLLFVPGCSRDDETPSTPGETDISSDAGDEVDEAYEEEEKGLEAAGDFDAPAPGLPSLAEIRSVSVETITGNPRDGFKAVVRLGGAQNSDVRYMYDWTVNGSDIPGAIEETLPWQEGFKRGDVIGVSVTPYSDFGQGAVTAGGAFTIPNSPPVISSEPPASYSDGRFTYTVLAEDPDGDPVDFTLRGAPPGMTIEPATGLIAWEYGEDAAGEYRVTVVAADSGGASVSQELTLTIAPGPGEE